MKRVKIAIIVSKAKLDMSGSRKEKLRALAWEGAVYLSLKIERRVVVSMNLCVNIAFPLLKCSTAPESMSCHGDPRKKSEV